MTADGPDDPRAPDLDGAQVIPLHAGDPAPPPARPARSRRRAEPRRATRRPGPAPVTPDAADVAPAVPDAPPKRARAGRPPATPDAAAVTPASRVPGRSGQRRHARRGPAPVDGPDRRPSTKARRRPATGEGPATLPRSGELPPGWEAALADALAFLRRRLTGDYAVDEFGFDPDLTDNVVLPLLRPLYRTWFRVETTGLHHVPDEGGALVVANHSGTVPLDALMTSVALHDDHPAHRYLRMLGADLVFRHAGRRPAQPQARQHAGLHRGRRAPADGRRAGRRVAGGLQGHRQAVRGPVQAAAVRPRRVRVRRAAHRQADHPVLDRRRRGDLPEDRATSRRWPGC